MNRAGDTSFHVMNATAQYNTNEAVNVVFNFPPVDRDTFNMVKAAADKMLLDNSPMPEDFEGVFKMEIITRPSGSKYVWVNFEDGPI